jgi:predicted HAD superfamily Cof-like phosphohydrolase
MKMDLSADAQEFRYAYEVENSIENEQMQFDLVREEFNEFATSAQFDTDEETLKELADLVYVCFQYAENLEWDLLEALRRVHASNMSKLGKDGKPLRRADGKVLKGPNYKPPVLTDLVQPVPQNTL